MKKAILAFKMGMTQVYDGQGRAVPVTVLKAGPCYVVQVKTSETDGYNSVQIGFGDMPVRRSTRPLQGHYRRAGVAVCRRLREFRTSKAKEYTVGQELRADLFSPGDLVDISAVTKGKGFAGSIKKLGFHRGPMTHGSHYHRGPGSLGSVDPNRVFKGRPLPGRMGGWRRTVQKLQVAGVDLDKNLLLIRGSVPGPRGGLVEVKEAVKVKR